MKTDYVNLHDFWRFPTKTTYFSLMLLSILDYHVP